MSAFKNRYIATKPPRVGTRARAVYNYLTVNPIAPCQWADIKAAYDNHEPAYNHKPFGPRYHSSMEVSRLLKKYASRVSRGVYRLQPKWAFFEERTTINQPVFKDTAIYKQPEASSEILVHDRYGYKISVGDKVKYLDDSYGKMKKDEVYTVKSITSAGWNQKNPKFHFVHVDNSSHTAYGNRFMKVADETKYKMGDWVEIIDVKGWGANSAPPILGAMYQVEFAESGVNPLLRLSGYEGGMLYAQRVKKVPAPITFTPNPCADVNLKIDVAKSACCGRCSNEKKNDKARIRELELLTQEQIKYIRDVEAVSKNQLSKITSLEKSVDTYLNSIKNYHELQNAQNIKISQLSNELQYTRGNHRTTFRDNIITDIQQVRDQLSDVIDDLKMENK